MSTDIAALVSDNLDLWTGAIEHKSGAGRGGGKRVTYHGIERLRALILDLAVRGKLVPQDARDEPAIALLSRSAKAMETAVQLGRFRPPAKILAVQVPEALPKNWAATRLGSILRVINGRAYKKPELLSEGTPVLRVGNLFTSNEWYYSNLELDDDKYIDCGDLIYAWSASFGPFIWTGERVIYHYHIWKLEPFSDGDLSREFLRLFLASETAAIKASGHGIAMLHMTKDRMEQLPVMLPPLAEQRRIVAKVGELMALCDALEAQSASALEAHQTLVETLLATLVNASDSTDLAHQWARLGRHFDTLFTTDASVDALRRTILDLGMRGKFSRVQDWPKAPTKLGTVAHLQNGYAFKSEWFKNSGVRLLRNMNVSHGCADWKETVYLSESMAADYERFQLQDGDVVLTLDRPFISTGTKVAIIHAGDLPALLLQRVARFQASRAIMPEFIYLWVCSPLFSEQIDPGRSNGVPHISSKQVESANIFVPDIAEQERIIHKLDKLLGICNDLASRLADAAQTRKHLSDAVVERAAA